MAGGTELRRRRDDVPPVLSVVTPTFNEAENLPLLVEAVHRALDGIPHEVVVADDDSPDGTWQVAERLAERDPTISVLRRFHDHGLSAAVLDGMTVARGEYLAVIDADLQHDPSILPAMLDEVRSGGSDVAVGSRSTEGGGYGNWTRGRRFVSWVATFIARVVLRVTVSDPMSGFFLISRGAYEQGAPGINPRGFKILLEFIGRDRTLRVTEVGYEFRLRRHGETKLNRSVIRSYLLAVAELRLGRQVDPAFLLYVLVISILLCAPLTFSMVEPDWLALLLRFVTRLALVPVVAAIAYEIIRFSAAHEGNPIMRMIITPGLWLQKMTTREPDDGMVACAIAALEPVLVADGRLQPAVSADATPAAAPAPPAAG